VSMMAAIDISLLTLPGSYASCMAALPSAPGSASERSLGLKPGASAWPASLTGLVSCTIHVAAVAWDLFTAR